MHTRRIIFRSVHDELICLQCWEMNSLTKNDVYIYKKIQYFFIFKEILYIVRDYYMVISYISQVFTNGIQKNNYLGHEHRLFDWTHTPQTELPTMILASRKDQRTRSLLVEWSSDWTHTQTLKRILYSVKWKDHNIFMPIGPSGRWW